MMSRRRKRDYTAVFKHIEINIPHHESNQAKQISKQLSGTEQGRFSEYANSKMDNTIRVRKRQTFCQTKAVFSY